MKNLRYLFLFLCFFPLLFFRDFTPNNELKYLSITDEALQNGHFFTFRNHTVPYTDKPPLYFWCLMAGKKLIGSHTMAFAGLFSLIPALILLAVMDRWVKKTCPAGSRNSMGLMAATSGLFPGAAIVLRMDMLMSLFIVLALYTFYRLYTKTNAKNAPFLLPVYIFLAVFSKGPSGLLLPLVSISLFLLSKGELREFGKYLGWKQWGIFFGLCLLWFTGVYLEEGKGYLYELLFRQTSDRIFNASQHKEPFWYYLKTIWYALAPWILFYVTAIISGLSKHLLDNDLKKFFLAVIGTTWFIFSLASSKLDIYLLPAYPFMAYLSVLLSPSSHNGPLRLAVALPASLLLFSFPGTLLYLRQSPLPVFRPPILTASSLLTLSSAFCLYFLYKRQLFRAVNLLSVGLLLAIFTGAFAIPSLNQYLGFREICRQAETLARDNHIENYYFFHFRSGENMDVYLKRPVAQLDLSQIKQLSVHQNFILFVRNRDAEKNPELQNIIADKADYPVGDYHIIINLSHQ